MAEWNRMEQSLLSVIGSVSQKEQHPNHSFEDCVINSAAMTNNVNISTEGRYANGISIRTEKTRDYRMCIF